MKSFRKLYIREMKFLVEKNKERNFDLTNNLFKEIASPNYHYEYKPPKNDFNAICIYINDQIKSELYSIYVHYIKGFVFRIII